MSKGERRLYLGLGIVLGILALGVNDQMGQDGGAAATIIFFLLLIGSIVCLAIGDSGREMSKKDVVKIKRSGNASDKEALSYFEENPCESEYTDSSGKSWDNVYFD